MQNETKLIKSIVNHTKKYIINNVQRVRKENENMKNYKLYSITKTYDAGKKQFLETELNERNADEMEVLKTYFLIKEKLVFNANASYRLSTLNYFSDGTITELKYTVKIERGEKVTRIAYYYKLVK